MKKPTNYSILKVWQYLWPYVKPYRFIGAGFILSSLAFILVDLAQAYLLKYLIDTALELERDLLLHYLTLFGLVFISGFVLTYIVKYLCDLFSVSFLHDFRYGTVSHIQKIAVPVIEKYHSGDLLSRLNNDLAIIQDFMGNNFLDLFKQLIMLVAAATYMVFINWQLLMVSIMIIPPSLICVKILLKPMQGYYKKANECLGSANAVAQDGFSGIFTVKAFNLQPVIGSKYNRNIAQGLEFNLKGARILRWIPPFNIGLRAIPTVVSIAYGGYLVVVGKMTPGDLIAFHFLLGFVQWPLAFLPDIINRIKRTMGAAERIVEILDIPEERSSGADFSNTDSEEMLSFHNVTFAYHEGKNVLDDVSFTVSKGAKIAIVGASGCGKSTIFKLLGGNYEKHYGIIKVMTHDTRHWNLKALRSLFAVISQEIFLFPGSVYENIAYGRPTASQAEIIAAARVANAHEFIMELPNGYDTLVGERGLKLSGGQKQRIALARAILKDAPILLLDEPTSALDTHSEALVQEAIERTLMQKTALIIAHRLSTIKNVDQILVMAEGTIVEQGTHEQLFAKNGLYTQLYLKQFNSAESQEIGEVTCS